MRNTSRRLALAGMGLFTGAAMALGPAQGALANEPDDPTASAAGAYAPPPEHRSGLSGIVIAIFTLDGLPGLDSFAGWPSALGGGAPWSGAQAGQPGGPQAGATASGANT
ncbi:hypothetical protein AB0J83_41645, partial [Actinoplanes sp. NPDC049596]